MSSRGGTASVRTTTSTPRSQTGSVKAGNALRAEADRIDKLLGPNYEADNPTHSDGTPMTADEAYRLNSKEMYQTDKAIASALSGNKNWQALVKEVGRGTMDFAGYHYSRSMMSVLAIRADWGDQEHSPAIVALRDAAAKAFGLPPNTRPIEPDVRAMADDYLKRYGSALTAYAKATYKVTQDWLASKGLTQVTLYRGTQTAQKIPGARYGGTATKVKGYSTNTFVSYSSNPEFAYDYAKTGGQGSYRQNPYAALLSATVPAADIFSVPASGIGNRGEWEFTVLNRPRDWTAVSWMRANDPGAATAVNVLGAKTAKALK